MIYAKELRKLGQDPDNGTLVYWGDLEVDSDADFADIPTFIPGGFLIMSSKAHSISDNKKYMLDGSGNWVEQDDSPFSDVYTKSQVDSLLSDIDATIALVDHRVDDVQGEISKLVDQGAKNMLNVYNTQTQTIAGITWTINADGTVTANGTATANSFLYLIPNNTNVSYGVETHVSGCPAGGSSTTYEIQVAMAGGTTYHDYGDGQVIPSTYVYRYFVCAVRSGQTVSDLVFKPMITESWKYARSQAFVPYSLTNAALTKLILNS